MFLILYHLRLLEKTSDPGADWILVDVADASLRGSSDRIRDKMTKMSQSAHRMSRSNLEAELQLHRQKVLASKSIRQAEAKLQKATTQNEKQARALERSKREAERSGQEVEELAEELKRRAISSSDSSEKHWLVQRKEIKMTGQTLGEGGWGEVKVAYFRGSQVAAKVLHKELQSPYYHDSFIREMNMASRVRHPNLVQFIGASMDEEMVILMELMPTSLREYLTSTAPGTPSLSFITCVSLDVARALNYLHLMQPHPIIHRDISSANVLLEPLHNHMWRAKVTDYGSVNLQNKLKTENPGCPVYSAPEANMPAHQSTKMDIFSFGVLMLEIRTAKFPNIHTRDSLVRSIKERNWAELVQRCLLQDAEKRPPASHILSSLTFWQKQDFRAEMTSGIVGFPA